MRAVFFLATAAALAGCIPAPYGAYYKPSYPDSSSTLQQAYCGGKAGPPTKLQFEGPGGLRVSVTAEKKHLEKERKDRSVRIAIDIPPGSRFQFLGSTIEISNRQIEGGTRAVAEFVVTTSLGLPEEGWIDFAEAGPTTVALAERYLASNPGGRFAELRYDSGELKRFSPSKFDISLPPILLGPGSLAVPKIELLSQDGPTHRIFRSRAYSQVLQDRYQACLLNTPERNCQYIPIYDPYAFKHEAQGFALIARFWKVGEGPNLHFEFGADARVTERWRLSSSEFRLKDLDSGEVRQVRLEKPRITWSYAIPLSAAVLATPSGLNPDTSLRIRTSLGEKEASRYFVKLPPFLLDGVTHRFSPIELELRRFDGGLEPFNC